MALVEVGEVSDCGSWGFNFKPAAAGDQSSRRKKPLSVSVQLRREMGRVFVWLGGHTTLCPDLVSNCPLALAGPERCRSHAALFKSNLKDTKEIFYCPEEEYCTHVEWTG